MEKAYTNLQLCKAVIWSLYLAGRNTPTDTHIFWLVEQELSRWN